MSKNISPRDQASGISDQELPLSRRRFIQGATGAVLTATSVVSAQQVTNVANNWQGTAVVGAEGDSTLATVGDDEMVSRYKRARMLREGIYSKPLAYNTTVRPCWIENSDTFWYVRQSRTGDEYRLVDATRGENVQAFNQQALADALSRQAGQTVKATALPIRDVEISSAPRAITFVAFDKKWVFDTTTSQCTAIGIANPDWVVSPDKSKAAFVKDFNIWVRELSSGREWPLTRDGERFNVYGTLPTTYGRQEQPQTLQALWSPDSRRLFTLQLDTRKVKFGPPLVEFAPQDDDPRPRILHAERRVAAPGDEHIDVYRFLSIDAERAAVQFADYRECPVFWPPYVGYFSTKRGWWSDDSRRAYFIDLARGGRQGRLVEFDTHSGKTRVVIDDTLENRFTFIPVSHLAPLLMPLPGGKEVIWYSERDGWAHLYLYDIESGKLKNTITKGNWLVRNVLLYDHKRRELFIQTAARHPGRNAYYGDICRVNIDTGELTTVISTDHDYVVCDQGSRVSHDGNLRALGVSPSSEYLVTTRSRVDQVPVSLLIDRTGKTIMEVETADVSDLPAGWQWPEPVKMTAADGKTDIYGVVFRPSNFSPDRSYPIIDFSYDYLMPTGSFTNGHAGNWMYLTPASWAELGFIVVMINSRGTGLRHKTFNTERDTRYAWAASPMWGSSLSKSDCVAGIRQLAEKYPYMDLNRVGVYGGNSPAALIAMFGFPEFYRVGATSNTCADLRLVGAFDEYRDDERLTMREERPLIYEDADRLKGKLLLVHGMLDNVQPVGLSFHIAAALQKNNKDFDMLFLPNDGHNLSDYADRRTWDYFVKHLMGIEPPHEFSL